MSVLGLTSGEPDFVNELGVKWWFEGVTTDYARKPDVYGTVLDAAVWVTEEPDGTRMFVLTDGEGVLHAMQRLEDIGVEIDVLKLVARK